MSINQIDNPKTEHQKRFRTQRKTLGKEITIIPGNPNQALSEANETAEMNKAAPKVPAEENSAIESVTCKRFALPAVEPCASSRYVK